MCCTRLVAVVVSIFLGVVRVSVTVVSCLESALYVWVWVLTRVQWFLRPSLLLSSCTMDARPKTPWYIEPQVTVHFTPTLYGTPAPTHTRPHPDDPDRKQLVAVEFSTLPFGIMFTKGKQVRSDDHRAPVATSAGRGVAEVRQHSVIFAFLIRCLPGLCCRRHARSRAQPRCPKAQRRCNSETF